MPKKVGKSHLDDFDDFFEDDHVTDGSEELTTWPVGEFPDTAVYVQRAMERIEKELKREKICCMALRNCADDFLTDGTEEYLELLWNTDPSLKPFVKKDRTIANIDIVMEPILKSVTARLGLQNMVDSAVLTIDALMNCNVDVFSLPETKFGAKGSGCRITRSIQQLTSTCVVDYENRLFFAKLVISL